VYRFRRLHFPSALPDGHTVLIAQVKHEANRRGIGMVDAQIGFKAIVARLENFRRLSGKLAAAPITSYLGGKVWALLGRSCVAAPRTRRQR
jgi:hypothetical protein